ncbi:response regulator transcription factor [Actinoplanes regularis]|uniref:Two component transcriptional regulator, LuxR family n=1 Tax=Actinoplanes regularis TaxID=52697 RepID=A0A239F061_9ACTN|nr:response regulator transcription factor [Actinoplanes regularis]GIE89895.1 DNA-binding response regulator [Actinoplanes regularis]GLW33527.1 DNA-binding response regulator [Actinoplanes regularis]SNS50091.1 two component transcriptional regulator, LuxR family [Actinoplanes regularis]
MQRSGAEPIRVLVVDDQQIVREGLVALVTLIDEVEVVGQAGDGAEAVRLARETSPHVVLMDLRMPVLDGAEATRQIVAADPETNVVVLSTYADNESIAAAMRAGARGYLTKDATRTQITTAIRSAAEGQSTFDPTVSRRLVAALSEPAAEPSAAAPARKPSLPDGLTAREAEVIELIARGLTNAEIAAELFIGETTVKTHINNAFLKIGAKNRVDAVRYAYQHGIGRP